jgi:hypothetical protein
MAKKQNVNLKKKKNFYLPNQIKNTKKKNYPFLAYKDEEFN